ncbi:MAG: hypothetical protein ACOZE5_14595 [Verrucomicrobiota bacterium]
MKLLQMVVLVVVIGGAMFLSGCMAAMMPAMVLGHSAHAKREAAREQVMKSCECAKPGTDEAARASTPASSPVEEPSGHRH